MELRGVACDYKSSVKLYIIFVIAKRQTLFLIHIMIWFAFILFSCP